MLRSVKRGAELISWHLDHHARTYDDWDRMGPALTALECLRRRAKLHFQKPNEGLTSFSAGGSESMGWTDLYGKSSEKLRAETTWREAGQRYPQGIESPDRDCRNSP